MTTKYKTESDQELTDELRSLAKSLKNLKVKHQSINPSTPQEFVEIVSLEESIGEIKSAQVAVGKELLARDRKRQKENEKRLEKKSLAGKKSAEELLKQLESFSSDVSVAFEALGAQYTEILALSDMVRKTNQMLLNSNLPLVANLFLEPNHLHKILKEAYRSSFGDATANVFLPQHSPGFDIAEAVEDIQKACSTNEEEAA